MKSSVVHSDPEIMSGAPVFRGTRVPAQIFLDYLADGENIESFLHGYPSVQRAQLETFLHEVGHEFTSELSRV